MSEKKDKTKVEKFRELIKAGKPLAEAISGSGVKASTAKTQMYKIKKEQSEKQ